MEWSEKGPQERGTRVVLERHSRISLDADHGKGFGEK